MPCPHSVKRRFSSLISASSHTLAKTPFQPPPPPQICLRISSGKPNKRVTRRNPKGDGREGDETENVINCRDVCLALRFAHSVTAHSSYLPATHALMRVTVTPRGSSASCRVCSISRSAGFMGRILRGLARLLGAAYRRWDPTARGWRSALQTKRGFLVGQGYGACE